MKRIVVILPSLCAAALSLAAGAGSPTTEQVRQELQKGVVFGVVPNADGTLAKCRFDMTEDLATKKPDPTFAPSATYIANACRKLSRDKRWSVSRDAYGHIKEVFDYCLWSAAIPDSPICRAVLG